MSQINRSELVVAHAHLCPLAGLICCTQPLTNSSAARFMMMDKLPQPVVCQSDAAPAHLRGLCTVLQRLHMPLQWTQPLACTGSSPLLLCPYLPHLKLYISANVRLMCCLSCWSVMKTKVAILHLMQGTDWFIDPNTLMLVPNLEKGICVISLIHSYKM